jgi:hypothetical protein
MQAEDRLLTDHPKVDNIHPILVRNVSVPVEVMRMPVEPQRPLLIPGSNNKPLSLCVARRSTEFDNDSPMVP